MTTFDEKLGRREGKGRGVEGQRMKSSRMQDSSGSVIDDKYHPKRSHSHLGIPYDSTYHIGQ